MINTPRAPGLPVLLSLFLLMTLASQTSMRADDDTLASLQSPLPIRDYFLPSAGFLFLSPATADLIDEGTWDVELQTANANTFSKANWISDAIIAGEIGGNYTVSDLEDVANEYEQRPFVADGELRRTSIVLSRRLATYPVELQIEIPYITISGGWVDGPIERFHRNLSIPDDERDSVSRDRVFIYVPGRKGSFAVDGFGASGIGDVSISAKTPFPRRAGRFRLATRAALQLPTGDERHLLGSGSLDAGFDVIGTGSFGNTTIHASAGLVRLGSHESFGTRHQLVTSITASAVRLTSPRTALSFHITANQSPFRDVGIPEIEAPLYQAAIGIRHEVLPETVVSLAVIENVLNFENSADIAIQFGLTHRFSSLKLIPGSR